MIVLDASALIEVLLKTPHAAEVERRIFAPEVTLHAPHLIDLEVVQVIRRYVRSSQISSRRGAEAVEDLNDFPLYRYPHRLFLDRIWELRDSLTSYDAAYVALAEILDAPLLTRDSKLHSALSYSARIEMI